MIEDWQHIVNEFNKSSELVRNPNTKAFFLSDETEVMGVIKERKNDKASIEIEAEILKKIGLFPGTLKHA
ncbi:hypothetical protein HHI36_017853, partial [Cryptolaemus montrouzieri]